MQSRIEARKQCFTIVFMEAVVIWTCRNRSRIVLDGIYDLHIITERSEDDLYTRAYAFSDEKKSLSSWAGLFVTSKRNPCSFPGSSREVFGLGLVPECCLLFFLKCSYLTYNLGFSEVPHSNPNLYWPCWISKPKQDQLPPAEMKQC